ncbi:PTS transporter subunit EIIC [Oscillospiraceae bacterium PP1C4]
MMANPKMQAIAKAILPLVGGKENLTSVAHCATRLRLGVKDVARVDRAALKKVDGVMGCVDQDGQVQVILGPGNAAKVSNAFGELVGINVGEVDEVAVRKAELKAKNNTPFKNFLKGLSNIFLPIIPAFIGCGMLYGLNKVLGNVPGMDKNFLNILSVLGKAVFAYMNIMVGMNVFKVLGGSPALGLAIAGVLSSSRLEKIIVAGEPLVPDAAGVIGVLLACAFGALLERRLRKIMPSILDLILTPVLVLLVTGLFTIYAIYPVSTFLTNGLGVVVTLLVQKGGILVGMFLSGTFLPLVMTGLHRAITPIETSLLESTGIDLIRPILAMAGAGQVGAGIAIYLRTRSKKMRQVLIGSIPIGLMGIGEPLMFGVTLPLGKPFITACIGSMLGGAYVAVTQVASLGIGLSGVLLTLLIDQGGHLNYLIGYVLAIAGGFLCTYFTKWDDLADDEVEVDLTGGNAELAEVLNLK